MLLPPPPPPPHTRTHLNGIRATATSSRAAHTLSLPPPFIRPLSHPHSTTDRAPSFPAHFARALPQVGADSEGVVQGAQAALLLLPHPVQQRGVVCQILAPDGE